MNDNIIIFPTRSHCTELYRIRHFETKFELREITDNFGTGTTKKVYIPLWPFGDGPVPDDELIVLEDVDHPEGDTITSSACIYFCTPNEENTMLLPIANTYHRVGTPYGSDLPIVVYDKWRRIVEVS